MNKNQRGFTAVFVLLACAVLTMLALCGWYVWQTTQKQATTSSRTSDETQTKSAAYTNIKYRYSVDFSAAKYHAAVWLAYSGQALDQADAISILPAGQQLDQPDGRTTFMSVQAEGTGFSQDAFRSMFMPNWELTFSDVTVGNSQAMLAHIVKYTGHPDLSMDYYFVKAKSGNVFSVSVLHGNKDAQAMLNSFIGN